MSYPPREVAVQKHQVGIVVPEHSLIVGATGRLGGEFACLFVLGGIHDLAVEHGVGVFGLGELDERDYRTGAITLACCFGLLGYRTARQDRRERDHDGNRSCK